MSKVYELPPDLWSIIMSYFHSCYNKPLHYEAIMGCEHFTRRRNINLRWGLSPLCVQTKHGVFDSFYIWIVLNNWIYWEFNDIDIKKPSLSMVRKVARGQIKEDFEEIWKIYACHGNETNLLSRIQY